MVYLGVIWPSLPATIPTNFNIEGVPERVGLKSDFLLLMIFLFLTNLMLYFLFRYIPHVEEPTLSIEPLKILQAKYYRIRFQIHIYLAVFTSVIIFMVSQGRPFVMERWVFPGVGVLIVGIGFYLRRLQPNYFVGVRTPWTLKSTDIWRQTHQMAGTLWISAGAASVIAGFFMPVVPGVFLLIFLGAILAALPYIYSYRLFNTDKG
ncbi:SdpI family protein [Chitinophaga oryziterrae]